MPGLIILFPSLAVCVLQQTIYPCSVRWTIMQLPFVSDKITRKEYRWKNYFNLNYVSALNNAHFNQAKLSPSGRELRIFKLTGFRYIWNGRMSKFLFTSLCPCNSSGCVCAYHVIRSSLMNLPKFPSSDSRR